MVEEKLGIFWYGGMKSGVRLQYDYSSKGI